MREIWKYVLAGTTTWMPMPIGAKVLHAADQRGSPCVWALVDPEADTEIRRFEVFSTGQRIQDGDSLLHVGSFLMADELLVWHVFEVLES